jgi:ABC-type transporter Mla subunit MlaD
MANETVLTIFVIVAAVAIVMQAFVMFGIWRAIEKIPPKIDEIHAHFKERMDPLTESVTEIVASSRDPLRTITANLAEISQTLRQRSVQVDEVVEDLVEKTRLQIIRADQVLTNLADKVEETTDKVQQGVLAPIQEITAAIKGLRSGFDFFFSKRRPPGATERAQDEQLFI